MLFFGEAGIFYPTRRYDGLSSCLKRHNPEVLVVVEGDDCCGPLIGKVGPNGFPGPRNHFRAFRVIGGRRAVGGSERRFSCYSLRARLQSHGIATCHPGVSGRLLLRGDLENTGHYQVPSGPLQSFLSASWAI